MSDLKRRHYKRQHPDSLFEPLDADNNSTQLLEPDFIMKKSYMKGNKYACSDFKSQSRFSKMKSVNQEVISNNRTQKVAIEIDLEGQIEPKYLAKDATQRVIQGINSE